MSRFEQDYGASRPTYQGRGAQPGGITQNRRAMPFGNRGHNGGPAMEDNFVPADIWMNVGIPLQVQRPGPDGQSETVEDFLSLPGRGIALDQLKLPSAASNSPYVQAQLDLWRQLMEHATQMAPGETEVVLNLRVQLRKVATETSVAPADNAYLVKAFA
ncbi:hypothetical protein [Roseococcus sp.]|uniref:hypothetical protein n=1 Tax=Roseococcus sp. TaxID=2109646 RepID=UPI003BA8B458